jgi:hypothetical protein
VKPWLRRKLETLLGVPTSGLRLSDSERNLTITTLAGVEAEYKRQQDALVVLGPDSPRHLIATEYRVKKGATVVDGKAVGGRVVVEFKKGKRRTA